MPGHDPQAFQLAVFSPGTRPGEAAAVINASSTSRGDTPNSGNNGDRQKYLETP
jgi:hypothetical protein